MCGSVNSFLPANQHTKWESRLLHRAGSTGVSTSVLVVSQCALSAQCRGLPTLGSLSHFECSACGATYADNALMTTCPACQKMLFTRYGLQAAAKTMTAEAIATRPWTMWRYAESLPVRDMRYALTLGEGERRCLQFRPWVNNVVSIAPL